MFIYVYNENFERVGVVGDFSYLLWRKRYYSNGEAELHVIATEKNINLLQIGRIIYRTDDDDAMYIYYRKISDDNKNTTLIIKAYSLLRWLDRRIIWGRYNFNDFPENVIRNLINSQVINPADPKRKIQQIQLLNDYVYSNNVINLQVSYKNLFDKIIEICQTHELGIRSVFDGNELFIDVYKGVDRTINQNENQRVILSKEFANVHYSEFEESNNDYKNTALIGGIDEGEERKITSIEDGEGLERLELFLEADDIQNKDDEGNEIPDEQYFELLSERGKEKLSETVKYFSFDCEIDVTKNNTQFRRDFYLGDLITFIDKKTGLIVNNRVEEVDEVFNKGKSLFVKIGKSIPTFVEKIKQVVN